MGTAASSFLNPITAELEGVGPKPTAKAVARRAKQRRQILIMIGASYLIGAAVLLSHDYAGATPTAIGPAFAVCGLIFGAGILACADSALYAAKAWGRNRIASA